MRALLFLGVVYFLAGIVFGELAGQAESVQARVAWRWAAWIISAVAFGAHIVYEQLWLRSSPRTTALHVSLAVATGARDIRFEPVAVEPLLARHARRAPCPSRQSHTLRSRLRDTRPTVATLSDWLRSSGSLRAGAVADVRVEQEIETSISRLTFLAATYTPDAPADMPRRLVVKSPLVPATTRDGNGEAHFYRKVAPLLGAPPLVRCVAALDEGDGDPETVVLEDLRGTHDHPPWPLPPSRIQCELALDALVRVHAHWWEAPTLGHTVGRFHTAESLTTMVHGIAVHLPAFIDALGDALTARGRRVYERVFGSSLEPWLRLTDTRALTVAHGDAHTWNFLFPRSGDGPAFLIDWQLWHLDLGARDLAFFMALHWYPSRRRELEGPLLKYYHQRLLARGLATYAFDELWLDYRRCVVRNLTIPILFWSRGMKPEGWWHRLECALAAYHDLGCAELS